ncbi:transposase [Streptomyces fructofermentans]|uniref:transposase n=1 Tax=Streptomyces fructofermentans TaxID=152141 RepID=UPI00379EC1F1
MTAVRHDDTLTDVLHEIGIKTNEIPAFAPLLDQIDAADFTDAVITVDALHAQKDHARYLVEQQDAHYLLPMKNNQPTLADQLRTLPWKEVPVLDRSRTREHSPLDQGRHVRRRRQPGPPPPRPAVMTTLRDLARATLQRAGWCPRTRLSAPPSTKFCAPLLRPRWCPARWLGGGS